MAQHRNSEHERRDEQLMARIRTVKPEFFEDEILAKLPPHDRLLFIGIWLLADKNGILEDRPTWIKAKVFPYENGDTVDVSRMLPRLVSGRYLIRYTAEGRNLIAVRNFTKHQRITGKEGLSEGRYPLPPNDLYQETRTGHIGDTHGTHLDAQEQGTGNREQGKERIVAKAPKKETKPDSQFDLFWTGYDKKTGKADTLAAWGKLSDADKAQAAAAAAAYAELHDDPKFRKDPVRFIKGRHWEDEGLAGEHPRIRTQAEIDASHAFIDSIDPALDHLRAKP
jgi:hypothetical protein